MTYFGIIAMLLMTSLSVQSSVVPNCLSTKVTRKIMKREESVEDISKPRYYRVCPNTFIPIREYDYTSGKYIGLGQDAISIWNPNVHILCADKGTEGRSENNCTFSGGTFHVDIIPADKYNINMTSYKLEGISVEGFQFINSLESNIVVYGTNSTALSSETNKQNEYGASVTIKNCLFHDNSLTTNLWIYENVNTELKVESSKFYDNTLIEDAYHPHTGLITSHVGGHISIHDTDFTNNYMKVENLNSGHRAIIYAVHDTNTTSYSTDLTITDSTFLYNEGMTFSLALSGLWQNEDVNVYSVNNYQKGNVMSYSLDNPCYGVAHLIQNSTYWDTYYYYYYYHEDAICDVRFDTTEAPSLMPSSSPSDQPSNTPTVSHPPSMSPSQSPSQLPSSPPSVAPTSVPSTSPSSKPTSSHPPSRLISSYPTEFPSSSPSDTPTNFSTIPSPTTFTPQPTKQKSTCYSDKIPLRILKKEMEVKDVSKPRYYRVCPHTIVPIASYDYQKLEYNGPGQDAISIWNPNVHILCAESGKKGLLENNCTFTGGTFQIELMDGKNVERESLLINKISIEGFRFRGATEANIIVYGKYVDGQEALNELDISEKLSKTDLINSEENLMRKRKLNNLSIHFVDDNDSSGATDFTISSNSDGASNSNSGVDIIDASDPEDMTEIVHQSKILEQILKVLDKNTRNGDQNEVQRVHEFENNLKGDERKKNNEVVLPDTLESVDSDDGTIFGVEMIIENCVFEDNRLNTNIWIYKDLDSSLKIMESKVEVIDSMFTYNQIVEDYDNPHLGLITSNIGGTFIISNTDFFNNFLDAPTLRSAHRAIVYSVQEQNDGYPTDLTLVDSTFKNNSGMTFALAITGLWFGEDIFVNAYNNYQKGNYLAYTLNNPCYGVAHLIQDASEYPNYYDYYYYHEDAICDVRFDTTEAPSMMPSSSPSNQPPTISISQNPSNVPIFSQTNSHVPTKINFTQGPFIKDVSQGTKEPNLMEVKKGSFIPTMTTGITNEVKPQTLDPILTTCLSIDVSARIYAHEWSITDTSQSRHYYICPGTVINIATFNYQFEEFGDDGEKAISIWNPNVHIVCGVPGPNPTVDNNCILNGGTFQIDIIAASEMSENFATKPLDNIIIQGFKMQGAKEANVVIYGTDVMNSQNMGSQVTKYGANVILRNCQFMENIVNTNIWLYKNVMTSLTLESCVFHRNILIEDDNIPHVGLITSSIGGKIEIRDTSFTNNQLDNPNMEIGMRAIILAVQVTDNDYHTDLSIMDSTFLYNTGITFTLVLAGLWENEKTVIKSLNNFQKENVMSYTLDNPCYGIAHLVQNSTLFEHYYYYYYHSDAVCDVSFDTTQAPSMNPIAILESSSAPYHYPSESLNFLPTRGPTNAQSAITEIPSDFLTTVPNLLPTKSPKKIPSKTPTDDLTISPSFITVAPSSSFREVTDEIVYKGEDNSEDASNKNKETLSESSAYSSRFPLLSTFTILLSSIIVLVSYLL